MEGIHPKFILSKRFPVHAAVEQLQLDDLERLLQPSSDAKYVCGSVTDVCALCFVIILGNFIRAFNDNVLMFRFSDSAFVIFFFISEA